MRTIEALRRKHERRFVNATYSKPLEQSAFPHEEHVVRAARSLVELEV